MAKEKIIVGIDIGTSKLCSIIASVNEEEQVSIIGVSTVESRGIKKGVVVDIDRAVDTISMSLEGAERMAGYAISKAFVSVGGNHVASLNSHGVVAISNPSGEIGPEDVARVTEAARAISIPSSREIIHVLPRNFTVDSQDGIHDPIGMSGIRLEVETHIVSGATTSMRNLVKCVQQVGVDVEDLVFTALAASYSTVSETERELGVVLVDIGGGTTSINVFVEGSVAYSSVLPIGGRNITNDLAIGLRTSLEHAEKVKLFLGEKEEKMVYPEEKAKTKDGKKESAKEKAQKRKKADEIDLSSLGIPDVKTVSYNFLVDGIIQSRLKEIMALVMNEIKRSGYTKNLPAGVVLTGGSSQTVGIRETAKKGLSMPVRIGMPQGVSGLIDEVQSPAYAGAVGLVLFGAKESEHRKIMSSIGMSQFKGVFGKVTNWAKSFLPSN